METGTQCCLGLLSGDSVELNGNYTGVNLSPYHGGRGCLIPNAFNAIIWDYQDGNPTKPLGLQGLIRMDFYLGSISNGWSCIGTGSKQLEAPHQQSLK